jgi:hypothetical protein
MSPRQRVRPPPPKKKVYESVNNHSIDNPGQSLLLMGGIDLGHDSLEEELSI